MTEPAPKPHYHGHRQRLRERFLTSGPDAFADYELLELLLFQAIPQRDVKPLAKDLLQRFGGFTGVINAPIPELLRVPGLGETSVATLKIVQAAMHRALVVELRDRPVLSNWQRVVDYCRVAMAHSRVEAFRVLFLDKKHGLIADEVQATGTIDHTPVYPREVVKRALDLGAAAIIMVHNHPSGDPTPSRADIEMTRQVVEAARVLNIEVHDHLVIGRDRVASFKAMTLM